MNFKLKIAISLLSTLLFLSCGGGGESSSHSTQSSTPQKLQPPKEGIYFGAFPDFGGSEDIVTKTRVKKFEKLIDKNLLWACFSQNWYSGVEYPQKAIDEISSQGVVPYVRLMPRSDEEQFHSEELFTMQNIIDGKFDKELHQWAIDAKDDGTPLLLDFAVEMNGEWFSWSGVFNGKGTKNLYGDPTYYDGAERYRDAYRHIIDIFREEDVRNITWFFHANINSQPNEEWNQPKYYYPGDDYIDWVGVSLYGAMNSEEDYWESFEEILESRYQSILDISDDKPFALLEFGVTDGNPLGDKAEWLSGAFETILEGNYIEFSAISYWHENWEEESGAEATIRVDSSAESLETFRRYVADETFVSEAQFGSLSR